MMYDLFFHAISQSAPQFVVFVLHGYGADRHDLAPIARDFSLDPRFDDVAFVVVDAPEVNAQFGMGRQWFSLPDLSLETCRKGLQSALSNFEADVCRLAQELGQGIGSSAFLGFSQGGMMALGALCAFDEKPFGVLGYSTFLPLNVGDMGDLSGQRVCLIHGESDPVVPFALGRQSAVQLTEQGADVQFFSEAGLGHGISACGLNTGADFLSQLFGKQ